MKRTNRRRPEDELSLCQRLVRRHSGFRSRSPVMGALIHRHYQALHSLNMAYLRLPMEAFME